MTVIIASRRESAERIAVAIADLHGAALGQLGSATRKTAPITIAGAPSGGATTLGQGQPVLARALSLPARMAAPRRQLLGVGTWPHRPPPMKISEGPYEDGAKTPLPLELVSRTLINLKLESSLRRYYLLASRRNMVRWYVSARRGPTRQSGTGVTGKQLPTAQHLCQIRSGGRLDRMSVEHRQWGRETPYWLQCKTT